MYNFYTKEVSQIKKIIFHVDVNSAYLSWTSITRMQQGDSVDLRTIPSIIGGDISKRRGVVLAKSLPAEKIRR